MWNSKPADNSGGYETCICSGLSTETCSLSQPLIFSLHMSVDRKVICRHRMYGLVFVSIQLVCVFWFEHFICLCLSNYWLMSTIFLFAFYFLPRSVSFFIFVLQFDYHNLLLRLFLIIYLVLEMGSFSNNLGYLSCYLYLNTFYFLGLFWMSSNTDKKNRPPPQANK